jgi:hypothetical protein
MIDFLLYTMYRIHVLYLDYSVKFINFVKYII